MTQTKLKSKILCVWNRIPDFDYHDHMYGHVILGTVSFLLPAVNISSPRLSLDISDALKNELVLRDVLEDA